MSKQVFLAVLLLLIACKNEPPKSDSDSNASSKTQVSQASLETTYAVQTFLNANNTWGYSISKDNIDFIRQETIPAMSGAKGFKTENQAQAMADLVIKKINQGILPPAVSLEEVMEILQNQ